MKISWRMAYFVLLLAHAIALVLMCPVTGSLSLTKTRCFSSFQASIWHWAVARLLLVLWEHDHEVIRHAHDLTTDDEVTVSQLNRVTI